MKTALATNSLVRQLGFGVPCVALAFTGIAARAADLELRPVAAETNGVVSIEYRSDHTPVWGSSATAPAGVELLLPGSKAAPVQFRTKTEREGVIELGPAQIGVLTLRLRLEQKTPALVQRTLEVSARAPHQFAVTFPLDTFWLDAGGNTGGFPLGQGLPR